VMGESGERLGQPVIAHLLIPKFIPAQLQNLSILVTWWGMDLMLPKRAAKSSA
jgi:hypothetical protein